MLAVLVLAGCGDGGATADGVDPICDGAPVTTWDNWGAGFVTQDCEACHASTAADRHDAPEDVVFDTEEDVWAQADDILAVATGDAPTMPPEGGVDDGDRYRLEVWLRCGG